MEFNKKQTKSILQIVFISILFYFFIKEFGAVTDVLGYIWSVVSVFAVGGAMAFIINVPMKFIESKWLASNPKLAKAKRPLAFLITLALVILVIYMVMFIVVPELISTLQLVIAELQELYTNLPKIVNDIATRFNLTEETVASMQIEWSNVSETAIKALQSVAASFIESSTGLIGGIFNAITQFIFAFIFCIYILFGKETLSSSCKKIVYAALKEEKADNFIKLMGLVNKSFSSFLSGQCLEAVILGSLFVVAMTIFRLPYALLVGVLIAVTALIPIVGAFIGCGVGAFLILMVNPMQALWFVILFLVIQQIEGNVIYPKVVGKSVGLPPILVFAAVLIGGDLMGVVGMLIFIPLTSVVFTVLKVVVETQIDKKQIPEEKLN